jgi:hypothetical protein
LQRHYAVQIFLNQSKVKNPVILDVFGIDSVTKASTALNTVAGILDAESWV